MQNTILIKSLRFCARCGCHHTDVEFKRLMLPHNQYTHWALCPYNEKPIMLEIIQDEKYANPPEPELNQI